MVDLSHEAVDRTNHLVRNGTRRRSLNEAHEASNQARIPTRLNILLNQRLANIFILKGSRLAVADPGLTS
jgi:hypothetical protein